MGHLCPSSSLQPANPSSALSRLVPVASPASAGSQQAINMLKEQNRLLTKVSGDTGGGDPLGGGLGEDMGRDWSGEGIRGSRKCSFSLASLGHPSMSAVPRHPLSCSCVQLIAG